MGKEGSKRRVIAGVIAAIVLIAAFAFGVHLIEKSSLREEQFGDSGDWGEDENDGVLLTLADKDYVSDDSVKAFLIAGTDGGGVDEGPGLNGTLADFILVLVIDDTTGKYAFYQIDRNSMVDVAVINSEGESDNYEYEQICTSHWYGRTENERNDNLVMAVTDLLGGLDIDSYYILNMKDIGKVNDAIGGVDVTIDADMAALDPELKEGETVHLTGKQAETFLRARKGLSDESNRARMDRQMQYMDNAFNMVIGQLRENPEYVNDLYDQLKGLFETDGNAKQLSVITDRIAKYTNMGFIRFSGETRINDTIGEGIRHEEFYVDEKSILSGLRKTMDLKEEKQ